MRRADQRKFHYIYKITRQDGRYYIGLHSTDDLNDGYFGSGQLLWKSIRKHGKEEHSKEILEFLPSRSAVKLREAELVNQKTLADPRCMNLAPGGQGGAIRWGKHSDETKAKQRATIANKPMEEKQRISKRLSEIANRPEHYGPLVYAAKNKKPETCAKLSAARIGKKASIETKAKLSAFMSRRNAKPVTSPSGEVFSSRRDAAASLGVTTKILLKMIRAPGSGWSN